MNPGFYPPKPARWPRIWLHALLLFLTLLTTSAVGARLAWNFDHNRPFSDDDLLAITLIWEQPAALLTGLPFSLSLLAILLAHELGHYFACMHYRIDASLPYFLPAPTLIGTFGAFIRIRSPIFSKKELFDVGIAGPLAGFALVAPLFAIGIAYSKVVTGLAGQGTVIFGVPLIQQLLAWSILPGAGAADVFLHPVARAAWVGVLATALNLLPIGQLDGGHILYAFFGRRHQRLSLFFVLLLVPLGFMYWYGWLFWAIILLGLVLFSGMRHPRIYDESRLQAGRVKLGWTAVLVFLLCFSPAPISYS